jgi:hypothetical protein
MGKEVATVRITNQFRSRSGFVYDFSCDGARLTLSISSRESPSDEGDWRVEARTSHAPESLVVKRSGPTRLDALREVASAWDSDAAARGLPLFDWRAVEKALTDVRAM